MKAFDWIVVGLGNMGTAVAYHLAKRGLTVLGLEKFGLNHSNGSSHGKSRIIRTAYFEHPSYVPLVKRALELWRNLEAQSKKKLLTMTGGLMIGKPDGTLLSGTLRSAREHDLAHELLGSDQIRQRFFVFNVAEGEIGVYEPQAGILNPEACIEAHSSMARQAGAVLKFREPVVSWRMGRRRLEVTTTKQTYEVGGIVFTAGAWNAELLQGLQLPLQCERQTVFWLQPTQKHELFRPEIMPVFIWDVDEGLSFYGIPNVDGQGVKVARHHGGEVGPPDHVRREITPQDEEPVREFVRTHIPWANGQIVSATTCLYTNTPDSHFIIDFHPRHRNVILVSACSGHGFKFASVIGEIVADMALKGETKHDIGLFKLARFSNKGSK